MKLAQGAAALIGVTHQCHLTCPSQNQLILEASMSRLSSTAAPNCKAVNHFVDAGENADLQISTLVFMQIFIPKFEMTLVKLQSSSLFINFWWDNLSTHSVSFWPSAAEHLLGTRPKLPFTDEIHVRAGRSLWCRGQPLSMNTAKSFIRNSSLPPQDTNPESSGHPF